MELTIAVRREERTYVVELFPDEGHLSYVEMRGPSLVDIVRELGRAPVWTLVEARVDRQSR